MKYLKLFEGINIYRFNIGDLVKITHNPKIFDNLIFEITSRQTIKGVNNYPNRNQYVLLCSTR